MRELILCEATDADVPTIVRLIHCAFEEYRGKLDPLSGAHAETDAKIRDKMSTGRVVLASLRGAPIGCVSYEQAMDHLSFSRLAVLPAYRRRGIGRALIAYVEDQARALNVEKMRLGVRIVLAPLRAYYERLGYCQIDCRAHDGYAVPTYVILEKRIPMLNNGEGK